jgi:hypothetical protein
VPKNPAACRGSPSGTLILAAIASVFTIDYIANLLGEVEDWLHELSIDMFPEEGPSSSSRVVGTVAHMF